MRHCLDSNRHKKAIVRHLINLFSLFTRAGPPPVIAAFYLLPPSPPLVPLNPVNSAAISLLISAFWSLQAATDGFIPFNPPNVPLLLHGDRLEGKCSEERSYWGSEDQELLSPPQSGNFLMRFRRRVFTVLSFWSGLGAACS